MLPASHRLTSTREFSEVIRRGRRAGSSTLVTSVLSPPPDSTGDAAGTTRAGFVVGRSVGDAVSRNRVKRRLRHLVGPRLAALPPGSRLVVRALAPAGRTPTTELAADLDRCLLRTARGRS